MTTNALYARLVKLVNEKEQEAPEKGFKSMKEWQKEFGKSDFAIMRLINKIKPLGKVEVKKFRRKWGNGTRLISYYRFIE